MKKFILLITTLVILVSCTVIPKRIVITSNEINRNVKSYVNIHNNLIFANIDIRSTRAFIRNEKIHVELEYNYEVFGGVLASINGNIEIESDVELKDNKLYLKSPRILNVMSNNEDTEEVVKLISSVLINSLINKPIYDFNDRYIFAREVHLTSNNLVIELQ